MEKRTLLVEAGLMREIKLSVKARLMKNLNRKNDRFSRIGIDEKFIASVEAGLILCMPQRPNDYRKNLRAISPYKHIQICFRQHKSLLSKNSLHESTFISASIIFINSNNNIFVF